MLASEVLANANGRATLEAGASANANADANANANANASASGRMTLPGSRKPVCVGSYRLTGRRLGKGNFARVEEALHTVLKVKVTNATQQFREGTNE